MKQFSSDINSFYKEIGMVQIPSDWSEVDKILNLTRPQLESMSPKDAAINAIVLSQYATFLQIKTNKIEAFIRWSEQKLKHAFDTDKTKVYQLLDKAHNQRIAINFLSRRIELLSNNFMNASKI